MKKGICSSFLALTVLTASTSAHAQWGNILKDLKDKVEKAQKDLTKDKTQPEQTQPAAPVMPVAPVAPVTEQPTVEKPEAASAPAVASAGPTIKTYEEYCAKLTSDPTLKKFAAEIKKAQKLGNGFFRGENPNPTSNNSMAASRGRTSVAARASVSGRDSAGSNPLGLYLESDDHLLTQWVNQRFKTIASTDKDFTVKNQRSLALSRWLYTCAYENKDTDFFLLFDPTNEGKLLKTLEQQKAGFDKAIASQGRKINPDGTISEANKNIKFLAMHPEVKAVDLEEQLSPFYATFFAVALTGGENVLARIGEEGIARFQAKVAKYEEGVAANQASLKAAEQEKARIAEEDQKKKQENEKAYAAQVLAAENAELDKLRNVLNFVRSNSVFSKPFERCVDSEKSLKTSEISALKATANDAATVAQKESILKNAADALLTAEAEAKANCVQRVLFSRIQIEMNRPNDFMVFGDSASALEMKWSMADFTKKGIEILESNLKESAKDFRAKCQKFYKGGNQVQANILCSTALSADENKVLKPLVEKKVK